MNEKIENLLKQAKGAAKHDWSIYEFFKGQVSRWCKSDAEYDEAIKKLIEALEV